MYRQQQQFGANPPQRQNTANRELSPVEKLLYAIGFEGQGKGRYTNLKQFFVDYDAFEDRIFDLWELQEMFPRVDNKVLAELHEINNRNESLKDKQISLRFLICEFELVERSLQPFIPHKTSVYVDRTVSIMREAYKNQDLLSKLREIATECGNYPETFFDKHFKQAPAGVDLNTLKRWDYRMNDQLLNNLFEFFVPADNLPAFKKISFCRAMKAFHDCQNQMPLPQAQVQQPMFVGVDQFGRPIMNANQFGVQQSPQNMFGVQPQMGFAPNQPLTPQQFVMINGQQIPVSPAMQPMQQFARNLNHVNQKDQIARDCSMRMILIKLSQFIEKQGPSYSIDKMFLSAPKQNFGDNHNAISQTDFEYTVVQQLQVDQTMARKLSEVAMHHQYAGYIDMTLLEQALRYAEQINKEFIHEFKTQLLEITNAIKLRYLSPYEFFKTNCSSNNCMNKQDFTDAMASLFNNSQNFTSLFLHLSGNSQQVPLAEMTGILKMFSKSVEDKNATEGVACKIFEGCSNDRDRVIDSINRCSQNNNGITLKVWCTHWMNFKESLKFFNVNDVLDLGQVFVREEDGMLSLSELKEFFNNVHKNRRLMRAAKKSILDEPNREQVPLSQLKGGNNPFTSGSTRTMTESESKNVIKPVGFQCNAVKDHLKDVLMALAIKRKTALEFFDEFKNYSGVLGFDNFVQACQKGLNLSLDQRQLQILFDDIASQLQGSQNKNTVIPESIDQYLFFSLTFGVQELQDELLEYLEDHYQAKSIDIEKEFLSETMINKRGQTGQMVLDKERFMNVAFKGTKYPALNREFLATMYMQIGGFEANHQKFLDDIKQKTKQRRQNEGHLEGAEMTDAEFTERLAKLQYFNGQNLAGVIGTNGDRRFPVYQQVFYRAIATQLGFGNEWMTYLRQLWSQLDNMKQDSVEFQKIESWINRKQKKSLAEMNNEIWRSLMNQNKKVQVIFDNDVRYSSAGTAKRISTNDFAAIIKAGWRITDLDADFFAKQTSDLQGDGAGVDARKFIEEFKERQRQDGSMTNEDQLAQNFVKAFALKAQKLGKANKLLGIFEANLKTESIKDGQHFLITEKAFKSAYMEIKPDFSYNELQVVLKKYESKGYVNYGLFLRDIDRMLSVAVILTEEQKKDAQTLLEYLKNQKKEESFWKSLKLLDKDGTLEKEGCLYLSENQILQAMMRQLDLSNSSQQTKEQLERKIKGLITKTEKDIDGYYSAKQFMEVLMGHQLASKIMDQKTVTFQQSTLPESSSQMQRSQAQPNPQPTAQSGEQQRKDLRILNDQQRKECQKFIIDVQRHCANKGLKIDTILSNFNIKEASIVAKEFVAGLDKICRDDPYLKTVLQNERNGLIVNLIFYLMRNKWSEIDVKKLKEAWDQRQDDPPLKQDGVEQQTKYEAQINSQIAGKVEQLQLFAFMTVEGKNDFLKFFNVVQQSWQPPISETEFKRKLDDQSYFLDKSRFDALVRELRDDKVKAPQVSMSTLYQNFVEFRDVKKTGNIKQRIQPQVQKALDEINKYLEVTEQTVKSLFVKFDTNGDGMLSREEFINGCRSSIHVAGLDESNFRDIYNAMDLNKDQNVSINEFGMYLQTAQVNVQAAVKNLDAQTKEDVQRQIRELFTEIDVDNDGTLSARELQTALNKVCDMQCTLEQAQQMIDQVDTDGNKAIDAREFEALMLPRMLENIVRADKDDEKYRAIFKKYDTDLSNHLSCDELYTVLVKEMGVQITVSDLIQMLAEFDVDGDGKMDIDEFVALMSAGNIQFQSQSNQTSFNKIRSARKLDQKDMLKVFLTLPKSFVASFTGSQWTDFNKNTPSSVFAAQIDPKTMQWKDMQRPKQTIEGVKNQEQTKLKPILVSLGGLITIEKSEGVPLPKLEGVQKIVKRVLRVAVYDPAKKDFIHNSCQVPAELEDGTTDSWNFQKETIVFRTSKQDQQKHPEAIVILELVIYVSQDAMGDKVLELSCGWGKIPLDFFVRASSSVKVEIQGGTPQNVVQIAKDDLNITRTGIKNIGILFGGLGAVKSVIVVSTKPHTSMPREETIHLECLPATCLIQKKLLWFVSGYRNYAAETLHKENTGKLVQPPCNVVMSCLPKILDNPDIVEALGQVWSEDVLAKQTLDQKKNIEANMRKAVDYIQRLYPAIFSDVFGWSEMTRFSALPQGEKKKARDNVLKSALRFGNSQAKEQVKQPLEDLTTFKPFNIRELEFLTFDDQKEKKERFEKQWAERGKLMAASGMYF